jgi:hypothetical protein
MPAIFHVMKEEFQRLSRAESLYKHNIADLPQGTIRIKHLRNGAYMYLASRQGKHVVDRYVGPATSRKAKETARLVEKRKRLQALLKETKTALKDVRRVLRGKV